MLKAKIKITLRPSILDVQGKAVEHGIHSMGYSDVDHVRIGKYIELNLKSTDEAKAKAETDEICKKLLANMVMEDYEFTIEKVNG